MDRSAGRGGGLCPELDLLLAPISLGALQSKCVCVFLERVISESRLFFFSVF